jgi:hypothetical protein
MGKSAAPPALTAQAVSFPPREPQREIAKPDPSEVVKKLNAWKKRPSTPKDETLRKTLDLPARSPASRGQALRRRHGGTYLSNCRNELPWK